MSLNIAIVTNSELRHKYFVNELFSRLNVKCIIIVKQKNVRKGLFFKIKEYGFLLTGLKILSIFYNKYFSKSYIKQLKVIEKLYFGKYESIFDCLSNSVFTLDSVNNLKAISLIVENKIDIICNLGGDIAGREFIASAKLFCLNIHSGLSPFYNGSQSAAWAFANQRPNFCGITLMRMNERIDGGDILAHYLPSIDINDTAATLFCKGIIGGVNAIVEYVNFVEHNGPVTGISQGRTFLFTRGMDWNILNDVKLNLAYRKRLAIRYIRPEKYIFYFNNVDTNDRSLNLLLDFLLKK
jgi:hypothetical protein